jgi:hypothetical protein
MAQIAKSMTVSVSVPCAALSIFGLLAIYFFGAKYSIAGCSTVLTGSILAWVWICWRSEEPATRTLVTLLLNASLWFVLLVVLSLARLVLEHRKQVSSLHVIFLGLSAALFWGLRIVAVRRNKIVQRA